MQGKGHKEMRIIPLSFGHFTERWEWEEISNCPGRYTMTPKKTLALSVKEFLIRTDPKLEEVMQEWTLTSWSRVWESGSVVRNVLWVARIEGNCGIISYEHKSGGFLHTLNSASGFERKLRALHIYNQIYLD